MTANTQLNRNIRPIDMTQAERAYADGLRDGALPYSVSNEWWCGKIEHFEEYCRGFTEAREAPRRA